jgi:signal transduction histidine kinase
VTGSCRGQYDPLRVQQSLRNLVSNAIRYGAADTPVRVALRGEEAEVCLDVANSGPPIEASTLSGLFDPLKRGVVGEDADDRGSLGLGLFIVREVARSHGGEVRVRSGSAETVFTVRLPHRGRCLA